MLHNKRLNGVLYSRIVNKDETIEPKDISQYPYDDEEIKSEYKYIKHKSQLKFDYLITLVFCPNGCYILICLLPITFF